MGDFPVTSAQIAGLFSESILYGIYLVTCGYCVRSLLIADSKWKRPKDYNWFMMVVALLLFIFATMDVCFGLYHNLQAFVFYTGSGGATEEFFDISNWVNVMKIANLLVQTNIGDAVLIYRCWVVYNKSWIIIAFSTVLWFGSVICSVVVIHIVSTIHAQKLVANAGDIPRYMPAFWTITITLNFLTTGLLVGRIWKVDRQTRMALSGDPLSRDQRPRALRHVIRIIIESGMLYTITAFLSFVTYMSGNNGLYPLTDMEVQIIGIAFNLIIIRTAQRRSGEARHPSSPLVSHPIRFQPKINLDTEKNGEQHQNSSTGIEIDCDDGSVVEKSSRRLSLMTRRSSIIAT